MNKKLFVLGSLAGTCLITFALFTNFTSSQSTLKPDEVNFLRNLVTSENSAKALFRSIESKAKNSLVETPNPVKRVYSEGLLASDPRRTWIAILDMGKIEALAWASIVLNDSRYEIKSKQFILAWARKNISDGNAINETKFEPLIRSYILLKKSFSASEAATVDNWLRIKANILMNQRTVDNWESHRILISGLVAIALNDSQLMQNVKNKFRNHLNSSFRTDGASDDFYHRDALHYHLYSIEPLLTLACAAKRVGENIFEIHATNGASLQKAVEFVVPYATGLKSHMEFQNTRSSFDRRRAAAGETQYIPHLWQPIRSLKMFSLAGCFDTHYDNIAVDISEKANIKYASWRSVLNAVESAVKNPVENPVKNPVAEDSNSTYLVNFNCSISQNNSGCQGTTSCKNGDEILNVKAVCNLEETWGNATQELQTLLPSLNWGGLQVARASDNIHEGVCFVNSTNAQSGKVTIQKPSAVNFGCRENDKNGGDCKILGQILCRRK